MNKKIDNIKEKNTLDTGLQCFITIAKFHSINVEAEQIKHTFAIDKNGMTTVDILKAAKEIGLKSKVTKVNYNKLKILKSPVIAQLKDNSYVIIAKSDEEKILILYPGENTPRVVQKQDFINEWNNIILLFVPRMQIDSNQKFGLGWFLPNILKYKSQLIEVLVATLTLQILGLFSPMMTQVVIDKVLVHKGITTLHVLAFGLLSIIVFETIMSIAKTYVFNYTTCKIDVILGAKLFRHLFALPLRYFETRRVGDTIARVRELENIRQFLTGAPLSSIIDTLFISIYILVMFIYSPLLTWTVLASIPFFVVLSIIVTPIFKSRLDKKFNSGSESQSYLVETVTGVQTVKSFALEPQIQKKWENLLADYVTASVKTSTLSGNASVTGQFIQKVADLSILWFGAQLVMDNKITIGQLIAFRMLSSRVSGPVLRLVQLWQEFQQIGISIQRLGDIFNAKPELYVNQAKTRLPQIKGNIKFDKVDFRYNLEERQIIKDVSFEIKEGTIIGIVGRSGSGKSTLSKLLQRLYIPQSGRILIDGIDISLADPSWLRRQIGVVLQENFLFNATISENIAIHHPTASMESIMKAAQIAGANDFILDLPQGYDTMVGEKGLGLSGGQKQRIAIARAILSNPKILIFDEATSALDYESESIIQKNLKQICHNRTVIIIAHRLSTLKDAHKILVMDKGEVVEYGTPEELLDKNGLYKYLYSQQGRSVEA